jgi:hypothetical protein
MIKTTTANPKELAAQLIDGQSLSFISYPNYPDSAFFLTDDRSLASSRGLQSIARAKRRINAPTGSPNIHWITGDKGYYHPFASGLADTLTNEVLWHLLRILPSDRLPVLFTGIPITIGGVEKLASVIYTISLGGGHG